MTVQTRSRFENRQRRYSNDDSLSSVSDDNSVNEGADVPMDPAEPRTASIRKTEGPKIGWDVRILHKKSTLSFWIKFVTVAVACIVVCIAALLGLRYRPTEYDRSLELQILRSEFPSQERGLHGAISVALQSSTRSVVSIVLIHDPEERDLVSCLIDKVTETFARSINRPRAVTINNYDAFNKKVEDYGKLYEEFKHHLTGAFVVKGLDNVLPENAQIFHSLCDDVTPSSPPSLFMFTIETTEMADSKKSARLARQILSTSWKSLNDEKLDPLLNRILMHVHQIKPQGNFTCSD